jgi:hypothetical protein
MGSDEKDIGISSGVETNAGMSKIKHVDSTIEKHAHDADEAMKVFEGISGEIIELDEATNRRLLKIIDWHMMPIMCLVYGMNYLDSMCISLLVFLKQSQRGFCLMLCSAGLNPEVLICDPMYRNHSLLC